MVLRMEATRTSADRCPGVLRPWIADDGALVRLRLVGGALPGPALGALLAIAAEFGDGNLYLTARANLQLRALPHDGGALPRKLLDRFRATGLLPAPSHELARNLMVSPLTGRLGGRADLRLVAAAVDSGLCADPVFADLAGRFLFVLDDGRGDLASRPLDLGLVALDRATAQLRVGSAGWGQGLSLVDAPAALLDLARRFLDARDSGPTAAWHVDELASPLGEQHPRDGRTHLASDPPQIGWLRQDDRRWAWHVDVPDGVLTPELAQTLHPAEGVVVTPWRSIVVPDLEGVRS
jgi:precorrin-3B synthase